MGKILDVKITSKKINSWASVLLINFVVIFSTFFIGLSVKTANISILVGVVGTIITILLNATMTFWLPQIGKNGV